jgi:hypothetical protein
MVHFKHNIKDMQLCISSEFESEKRETKTERRKFKKPSALQTRHQDFKPALEDDPTIFNLTSVLFTPRTLQPYLAFYATMLVCIPLSNSHPFPVLPSPLAQS